MTRSNKVLQIRDDLIELMENTKKEWHISYTMQIEEALVYYFENFNKIKMDKLSK